MPWDPLEKRASKFWLIRAGIIELSSRRLRREVASSFEPALCGENEHLTPLLLPDHGGQEEIHPYFVAVSERGPRRARKREIEIADERRREGEKTIAARVDCGLDRSDLPCRAEHLDLDDCFLLGGDTPGQHEVATTLRPRRYAVGWPMRRRYKAAPGCFV